MNITDIQLDVYQYLPADLFAGTLIGRAWIPEEKGPSPVLITKEGVFDLSFIAPTCADLLNSGFNVSKFDLQHMPKIGKYEDIMYNTIRGTKDPSKPWFLSPVDLQAIKACGVTFMVSMLERVIEERAGGDATKAQSVRERINSSIGTDVTKIKPGSEQAESLKQILVSEGLWSQYMEVGIGPFAEVFTKSQPLSSVGIGELIGVHPISSWNNPEPEIALLVNSKAEVLGATLGNDVNLRDIEGRSALLLGKAKDNNASCALGPFIRLFDDTFNLNNIRSAEVSLHIKGEDGFTLRDSSYMTKISRDVLDLVSQTINENHQYPDGIVLFTGTLFAPTQDRDGAGKGFTHKLGDIVSISSEKLGMLQNKVTYSNQAPPWEFGISALMKNLSKRGLIK